MRRVRAIVIASVLAHGCAHGLMADTSTGGPTHCGLNEVCGGGSGVADGVVTVAVVGVVVGAVAVAVIRRLVQGAAR